MPLVGGEFRRVGTALRQASQELETARLAVHNRPVDTIGTPGCEDAVAALAAGLSDVVGRLSAVAGECAEVTGRHVRADEDGVEGPE